MVKAKKVGKRRPFWRGFFLTLVTLGIYGIYWNYKAHHELFSQFDLDDEGKDEGLVWLILGILFAPLLWVYQYRFVKNVIYVRDRLALPGGVTAKAFLALTITASAIAVVFSLVFQFGTAAQVDPDAPADDPFAGVDVGVFFGLVSLFFAGLVVSAVLAALAYAKLQGSINEAWNAFDRRVRELTAPPAAPPSSGPPRATASAPAWVSSPGPARPR